MSKRKRKAVISHHCVSCGACVKECPFDALSIWKGISAQVDCDLCIGCGKCERVCPANAINILAMEVNNVSH